MADLNSTIVRGNLRVTEDINTNGNITGSGSGLTNLNASNISSGTLSADRLDTSGAAAGSYGPSANATPGYGGTFNVPYITIDNKGRVTKASTQTITIPASDNTDTDTHYTNYLQIKGNGTEAIKFTQDGDKSLNLKPGTNVSISAGTDEITISATDTNTWRGIQDNLTSTSTTESLSANQGRVLKGLVDGKVNSSDLVALTLTNNSTKRYLIGSASATSWSDIGTNSSCYTQSGSLYATYFYGTSDKRLKENIKDLELNCLDLVNNINLREFSWKADDEHKPVIGAIAQELKQILPEKYVHEFIGGQETKDEYLSINDSKLVYLLIGAIQEQQKEIEHLKAKIDSKIV